MRKAERVSKGGAKGGMMHRVSKSMENRERVNQRSVDILLCYIYGIPRYVGPVH